MRVVSWCCAKALKEGGGRADACFLLGFVFFLICYSIFSIQTVLAKDESVVSKLALSKSPSPAELTQMTRLRGSGFGSRPRLYIRLFKEEKELEVWVLVGKAYKLFQSFRICAHSGTLGPKLKEGDRQAPEGFYHVPVEDLLWRSQKWPQALNLGFPNVFDAQNGRTGSYLLIHGGCSSKGCYALENGPMKQLFALVSLAARAGQKLFPIHIFPFRFGKATWRKHKGHRWSEFWQGLAPAYSYFNQHRLLPQITVCDKGYQVARFAAASPARHGVVGRCVLPMPLFSAGAEMLKKIDWLASLRQRYERMKPGKSPKKAAPQFVIRCNLKRPSCRKWVALKKKRLARRASKRGG